MSALSIKEFISDNFRRPKKGISSGKPRIEFIDLAKGVCILLVVLFHCGYNLPALNAMRMPLYFILSGLFFKDYGSFVNLLYKKINKILIPFCFFAVIGNFILILLAEKTDFVTLFDIVFRPIFKNTMAANGPVWFLICLFWVNIIYCIISLSTQRMVIRCVAVLIIGTMGYLLSERSIYLPLFLGSSFSALPFFFIGVMMRRLPILYAGRHDIQYLIISVIIMIITILYCWYYGTPYLEFRLNLYNGNLVIIYFVSISMVVGLLMLCKGIGWLPIISYFGRYSIIVLGLHWLFKDYTDALLYHFTGYIMNLFENLLLTLFLCWISIPLCRHFIPFFTAQTDLIKMPKRYAKQQGSVSLDSSIQTATGVTKN